jgi:SAM-dependent methyltransferase
MLMEANMQEVSTPQFDEGKLNQFVGRMLGDVGAVANGVLTHIGDRLGFYKALMKLGSADAKAVAAETGTSERMVREWLSAQAAQGYIDYHQETDRFSLSPEKAMVFADENSPVYMAGFFDIACAVFRDEPKITESFKSGRGLGWNERNPCLFCGTARFFRTTYQHHLVNEWLPALYGVAAKLERGGIVADVGCGHGISTIIMAQAFPNARFHGYDAHPGSIDAARQAAAEAGVSDRVSFDVALAKDFPARSFDLVCFFDCLHDLGDPVGAAAHVREAVAPDGSWMIVEPFSHDHLADNLNPIGAIYYAASTMICTPASLAQEVGLALGAQAGETKLRGVAADGGFEHFRRVAETPFNMVFEARREAFT